MRIAVTNEGVDYKYFDTRAGVLHDNIWDWLTPKAVRNLNLAAHVRNTCTASDRPDTYQAVLLGVVPIPPRSRWMFDGYGLTTSASRPVVSTRTADRRSLLKTCSRLLGPLRHLRIGVELSGGLDTSIIIGILKQNDIRPVLAGLTSSRYEFRTEAAVQHFIASDADRWHLIDYDEHLPFAQLLSTPPHQLPAAASLFHSAAEQLARAFGEDDVSLVLNGHGMDMLLCDPPPDNRNSDHLEGWFPWMMGNAWLEDYVFRPNGVRYKSAASSRAIIRAIWSMRNDEAEDTRKWWARHLFSEYLPRTLVDYAYNADFAGLYIDGLQRAIPAITEIAKVAFEFTRCSELSVPAVISLIDKVHKNDYEKNRIVNARISFASWVYGLARKGLL